MVKHVASPCPDCPFSRTVKPGALGGSPVETFIGQALGPFLLPCHKACDFNDPNWKLKVGGTPQCAGAAIFRTNVGSAPLMPKGIHKLPMDRARVFSSPAEFMAHHKGISKSEAEARLRRQTPFDMLREQLQRSDNIDL